MKEYHILSFVERSPEIPLVCENWDICDLCSQQLPATQNKKVTHARWCKEFKLLQIGWATVTVDIFTSLLKV